MDEVLLDILKDSIEDTFDIINRLNPGYLKRESNNKITFIYMEIHRKAKRRDSTWYTKSTDAVVKKKFDKEEDVEKKLFI